MSGETRSMIKSVSVVARIAVGLAAVGVIVSLVSARSLGKAVLTPSAKQKQKEAIDQIKKHAADYALALEGQVKQFNGRSVFFIPSPPTPPPQPAPPIIEKKPEPPSDPPKPTTYGGPKLIAMVNGVAWFEGGKKMAPGDEVKDKLKVKEVNAPWYTLVEWDSVEFKVPLFEQDSVVYPPPKKEEPKKEETKAAATDPVKESKPADVKTPDKPEAAKPEATKPPEPKPEASPKPEDPKPETPKPEEPKEPKPDQPEAPKPEQPKTPDSSHEGQIEKDE